MQLADQFRAMAPRLPACYAEHHLQVVAPPAAVTRERRDRLGMIRFAAQWIDECLTRALALCLAGNAGPEYGTVLDSRSAELAARNLSSAMLMPFS